MSESNNLFICFSADDNASNSNAVGWIDNFIRYLVVYIQRINNQSPNIIQMKDSEKRPASLGENDGVILVVSKNYLDKGFSKLDLPLISDQSRVYKIDLEPIRKNEQPKEIRVLNEFHFFESTPGKENFATLTGKEGQNFWLKIIDLAFEINRTIYRKSETSGEENRKKIYLAETSYDQVQNRDEIKRELMRHGHIVLPKTPFSSDFTESKEQIQKCLEQSDLSVHLIGDAYGEVPDGADKSIVEIQNELSTEYYAGTMSADIESMHRLIWMPLHLKARTDQQKLYLDKLRDDISSTAGAEIIQTPLEILKTVVHSRLQVFDSESRAKKLKDLKRSDKKTIYLLFDKKDEKEISSLIDDITARNMEVILPSFDDKQIDFLENHRESLVKSDGVLLFANKNLNWVNSKLNDVIKAPGFGKQFPFEAKGIYIKNSSIPKEKIATFGELVMLNGDGKNKKINISPFLDKIASS